MATCEREPIRIWGYLTSVAWPAFARRYPAKPRPTKPDAIIAQVEGSGTAFPTLFPMPALTTT